MASASKYYTKGRRILGFAAVYTKAWVGRLLQLSSLLGGHVSDEYAQVLRTELRTLRPHVHQIKTRTAETIRMLEERHPGKVVHESLSSHPTYAQRLDDEGPGVFLMAFPVPASGKNYEKRVLVFDALKAQNLLVATSYGKEEAIVDAWPTRGRHRGEDCIWIRISVGSQTEPLKLSTLLSNAYESVRKQ